MPGVYAQLFTTPNPTNDIAFVLLDRIFGVPVPSAGGVSGFFGSCVGDSTQNCSALRYDGNNSGAEIINVPLAFPWNFHLAMHQMFAFFSYTIAAVALFILLYFVAAIILESIQSGTPFGKRFSKVWAPLRLVMAFALIIPVSNGLNLAQYGVLYSAKWGSSLATNVWQQFNVQATVNGLMDPDSMVGTPQAKDAMEIVAFMHLVNMCEQIETSVFQRTDMHNGFRKRPQMWFIDQQNNNATTVYDAAGNNIKSYMDAEAFFDGGDMVLRFGSKDPGAMTVAGQATPPFMYSGRYAGNVIPFCGEIIIPAVNLSSPGSVIWRQKMYEFIVELWSLEGTYSHPACDLTEPNFSAVATLDSAGNPTPLDKNAPGAIFGDTAIIRFGGDLAISSRASINAYLSSAATNAPLAQFVNADGLYKMPISLFKVTGATVLREHINCIIEAAVDAERANIAALGATVVPQPLLDRGWAGAGIWYNRIAEINGGLIAAVNALPSVKAWPMTMQHVAKIRRSNEPNPQPIDLFNPYFKAFSDGAMLPRHGELAVAKLYHETYKEWVADGPGTGGRGSKGNTFESAIAWIFGIDGLYSMVGNTDATAGGAGTVNVHPLAKLSGLGKSLIESSIRNLTLGAGAMVSDLVSGSDNPLSGLGDAAGAIGSALVTASGITLTAGFILFYIVPMLPFMYFFFAVGTWVKTVFEAMVGVPLWALAHLHIEGGGLPGQKAANGYYLLFEIFVRPVMIVMAFLASITIFSAMSNVLIDIWEIAMTNVGGSSQFEETGFADAVRAPIDKMFYLVMFTMLLYMIGVSSFKLVDQIPQSILRWVGASVPTFVDQKEDLTSTMVSRTAMAANQIFGQFTGGITKKYQGVKQAQAQAAHKEKVETLRTNINKPDNMLTAEQLKLRNENPAIEKSIKEQMARDKQGN